MSLSIQDLALVGRPGAGPTISPAATAALDDWASRVQGAGSDVTIAGTQTAVGLYIDGLMTDGVWSKLVRHGINAGDGLLALKTPLKNGGGSTPLDSLNNFVSGDYSQSVGLTGDGTTKYVRTGISYSDAPMGDNDIHLSIYSRTTPSNSVLLWADMYDVTYYGALQGLWRCRNTPAADISWIDANGVGMYVFTRTSASTSAVYKNGSSVGTNTAAGGVRPNLNVHVHCAVRDLNTAAFFVSNTIEMYSVGLGLTATDAASFTSRYATLRTALGR